MSKRKTVARVTAAAAALTLGGTVLATTGTASAAAGGRNGTCDGGEFCLYYNSNQKGSLSDFTGSVKDYGAKQPGCYDFKSAGAGKGVCVKNHAASVWNRSSKTVRVYFNSNYGGKYQDFKPGVKGNLNASLKNQNASHSFGPVSNPSPGGGCKSDGSNTKLPTSILVYRVNKGTVERVNFKTYVKNVLPNEWIVSWKPESLKAGAMAVKSYAWWWALHSTRKHNGHCFDVYDNTSSQVYRPGSATAATNAAVDATFSKRMTRGGQVFMAQYCSTTTACGAWKTGDWMSQYGSQDKAKAGWSYSRILKAYYRGITIS